MKESKGGETTNLELSGMHKSHKNLDKTDNS